MDGLLNKQTRRTWLICLFLIFITSFLDDTCYSLKDHCRSFRDAVQCFLSLDPAQLQTLNTRIPICTWCDPCWARSEHLADHLFTFNFGTALTDSDPSNRASGVSELIINVWPRVVDTVQVHRCSKCHHCGHLVTLFACRKVKDVTKIWRRTLCSVALEHFPEGIFARLHHGGCHLGHDGLLGEVRFTDYNSPQLGNLSWLLLVLSRDLSQISS